MRIAVTHDIGDAFRLSAEVVVLNAGRVLSQGTAEEVLASERVRLLRYLDRRDGGAGDGEV
jgi:ABC-type cobalamin/Fe3+-siderophores transport system ATPase subunit